jgi:type IV pilus assembly protein PilW
MRMRKDSGFTLIELLIAVALGLVIMAGLYQAFRTQQDSYIVQDQVAAMQQNLRGAMYLITRDLQMAGWYSNFDRNNRAINLGDLGNVNGRPILFSVDNSDGAGGAVNVGTDALVILKAGTQPAKLQAAESATGTSVNVDLSGAGINTTSSKYGLLVKNDLRTADFFELASSGTVAWTLAESYQGNADPDKADMVFRSDIVIYKVKNDATTGRPMLYRKNLGSDNGYQPVAENIENLQVRYYLENDPVPKDTLTAATQNRVRAVEIFLVGRTAFTQKGYTDTETYNIANNPNPNPGGPYRRKVLSTIIKTRNIGLSS